MPTSSASSTRPARACAEARKQQKKQARELERQRRVVVDEACRNALRRASLPRHEQLRACLGTTFHADHFTTAMKAFVPPLAYLQTLTSQPYAAAVDVVCAVEARAPGFLLAAVDEYGSFGRGVVRLAQRVDRFVRAISTWRAPQRRPDRVWRSLVQHTLHRFPVPSAWDIAFLDACCPDVVRDAIVAVANGQSWRTVTLPTFVNRAIAHELGTIDIESSSSSRTTGTIALIREAQARALGVSPAHRLVIRRHDELDAFLGDEAGLEGVFAFFARHPELSSDDVKTICTAMAGVDGDLPSMKGRTPRSLVALSHELIAHKKLRDAGRLDVGLFPASPVAGGRYVLVHDKSWEQPTFAIAPITTGKDLVEEGIAMRHCVGTYADRARSGEVVIFGVRVEVEGSSEAKRALTIEVRPEAKAIVQVRGKGNRAPTDVERGVIRCWAKEQGLWGAP